MLEMRGRRGTAILIVPPCAVAGDTAAESRPTLSSSGSSRAPSNQGTRPNAAHPVFSSMIALAPSKSVASPRNLLMRKPLVSARSGWGSSAQVPTRLAITPPRSTSPTSATGTLAAQAKPMLAMSFSPQVHLGRAARAFHQDQVGAPTHPGEAFEHAGHQRGLERVVTTCVCRTRDPALHHHLGARLALGLQQHRVHVGARLDAGGAGLQRLGAADLAPVRRHRRVVGHVLRLEGAHSKPTPGEGAAESGDEQGFSHVGARALEHQGRRELLGGARHQNSIPSCAFTPARKGCLTSVISVTRSAISISADFALRPVTTTCWLGSRPARPASTSSRAR